MKRSEAKEAILTPGEIFTRDADIILEELEARGMVFDPEGPDAVAEIVEEWNNLSIGTKPEQIFAVGNVMRDQLQARIAALEAKREESPELKRRKQEWEDYLRRAHVDKHKRSSYLVLAWYDQNARALNYIAELEKAQR